MMSTPTLAWIPQKSEPEAIAYFINKHSSREVEPMEPRHIYCPTKAENKDENFVIWLLYVPEIYIQEPEPKFYFWSDLHKPPLC